MANDFHPTTDAPRAADFLKEKDPLVLFAAWLEEAKASETNDPNAMALATVDETGQPNARMVLLKGADASGFSFFTNYGSAKGRELLGQGKAAAVFHWKSLRRQVRLRGPVEQVAPAEADDYFATRAKRSQIGAWASKQSRPLESRFALEKEVAKYAAKYGLVSVPRPPHWSGFRILPVEIEFWHDRPFRLHDRLVFRRQTPQGEWTTATLYP